MRRSAALVILAAAALASACGQTGAGSDDRERLEARQAELVAAQGARDADRVAALFATDGVLHVANRPPIEGRDSIRQFYGHTFQFLSDTRSASETVHVSGSGDLAYATGSVVNEFRGPDGAVEYTGKYVVIWREIEGEWMVALYGVSSNHTAVSR